MTDAKSIRELALDSLIQIQEKGAFSNEEIAGVYKQYPDLDAKDRAFYTRLVEGTVEEMILLDYYLDQISSVKVRKMKPLIRVLLRMSAYQILRMDKVPDFAVCSEAVDLAKKRGFVKLKGFVNGVLRNLSRKKDDIALPDQKKQADDYLSIKYSTPKWIVSMWKKRYGFEETEQMLAAFYGKKPICLWTNTRLTTSIELKNKLESEGVILQEHPWIDGAFFAEKMEQVASLNAFREGLFYIQDTSSLLSILSADVQPGMEVIDVCGAPGGKSLYAYERMQGEGHISCRDLTKRKTAQIIENKKRLRADGIEVVVWNAEKLREQDIERADLVICDLPCSGLGVIGRKSDIRYRVTREEIKELAEIQKRILTSASQYVKPGGTLIFSTCTITKEENEDNAAWIQENLPFTPQEITDLPQEIDDKTAKDGCLQLLPHQGVYHDGFFFAVFRKAMQ